MCCHCWWLFHSLFLHLKNTKFSALRQQPLSSSQPGQQFVAGLCGNGPPLHHVVPSQAALLGLEGSMWPHWQVRALGSWLGGLWPPHGLLLQLGSLDLWWLGSFLKEWKLQVFLRIRHTSLRNHQSCLMALVTHTWASLVAQPVRNPPAMQETLVRFLGREDPLKKGLATHSSILGLLWWFRW